MPRPDLFTGPPFPPFWPPSLETPIFFQVESEQALELRQGRVEIPGVRPKTFSAAVSITYPFVSAYSGSGSVVLTDAGQHTVGVIGLLLFPAGTATSVSWPGAWATAPGSEAFTTGQACAVFLRALDRIHVTLKRVVFV